MCFIFEITLLESAAYVYAMSNKITKTKKRNLNFV